MDWRYTSIWFDEIDESKKFHAVFKGREIIFPDNFNKFEYVTLWHFNPKAHDLSMLPESDNLLYLQLNWSNIKDLKEINKYKNLRRLELHYCTKLESDSGIKALKDTLEFLCIDHSKKYLPTTELHQLKKLTSLRLNSCAPLKNLEFLYNFPKLRDFIFVHTNIIDGNLSPILKHPTIRFTGFMDKRHYNLKLCQAKSGLNLKSDEEFMDYVYKGEYRTFKYK